MRRTLALALALAALGPPGQRLTAAPPSSPRVLGEEITPALRLAVARGYEYFVRKQLPSGEFDHQYPVAVTGLVGLAFLAGGHTPRAGDEHAELLRKAIGALLGRQQVSGYFEDGGSHMYGHGFATLFLGEVYGMTGGGGETSTGARVHQALVRAVRLIESSQNEEGGWRYNPVPYDADVSVTICQVMGLRAARNAGLEVPKRVVDRAVEYVRTCQNPDGGFRYQTMTGGSAWPRSAAGIASLFYAGIYEDRAITSGLKYLAASALPGRGNAPRVQMHYYYGHYYAVQAMFLAGGDSWATWWPAIRRELINNQQPDGLWDDDAVGKPYATAMALIILQMPKRYLPIFQK